MLVILSLILFVCVWLSWYSGFSFAEYPCYGLRFQPSRRISPAGFGPIVYGSTHSQRAALHPAHFEMRAYCTAGTVVAFTITQGCVSSCLPNDSRLNSPHLDPCALLVSEAWAGSLRHAGSGSIAAIAVVTPGQYLRLYTAFVGPCRGAIVG